MKRAKQKKNKPRNLFDELKEGFKALSQSRPRTMTTVTLQIPADVIKTLKEMAKHNKVARYQTLIITYINHGLRADIRTKDVDDALALVDDNDIAAAERNLKGIVRKPDSPVSIEDMNIQSMQSLKKEMLAVARGERKAPADAGLDSFTSTDALNAFIENQRSEPNKWDGKKCPICGAGVLHADAKICKTTYKGQSYERVWNGFYCDKCDDGIVSYDADEEAAWIAFRNKVDGK